MVKIFNSCTKKSRRSVQTLVSTAKAPEVHRGGLKPAPSSPPWRTWSGTSSGSRGCLIGDGRGGGVNFKITISNGGKVRDFPACADAHVRACFDRPFTPAPRPRRSSLAPRGDAWLGLTARALAGALAVPPPPSLAPTIVRGGGGRSRPAGRSPRAGADSQNGLKAARRWLAAVSLSRLWRDSGPGHFLLACRFFCAVPQCLARHDSASLWFFRLGGVRAVVRAWPGMPAPPATTWWWEPPNGALKACLRGTAAAPPLSGLINAGACGARGPAESHTRICGATTKCILSVFGPCGDRA